MTNLLLDEGTGITVRDGVFSIIIEVEIPRNGGGRTGGGGARRLPGKRRMKAAVLLLLDKG